MQGLDTGELLCGFGLGACKVAQGESHCFWRVRVNGFQGRRKARECVESGMSFRGKGRSNREEDRDRRIAIFSVVNIVVIVTTGGGGGGRKEGGLKFLESKGTSTGRESVVIGLSGAMGGELEEGVEGGGISLKRGDGMRMEERG